MQPITNVPLQRVPRFTRRTQGFTLIELVVVLLLLTVLVGMVGLNLGGGDSDDLRDEAERLALLLHTAQQEAILEGQVLALALAPRGYHFMRLSEAGTLRTIARDALLRPRELPAGVTISVVEVDGKKEERKEGIIVLQPSGELVDFTITLRKGNAQWQVKGSLVDGIRSAGPVLSRATS
ncbi:MAG: GspH/FimT family pseudopilin [Acidiferrobacterales bacterium]